MLYICEVCKKADVGCVDTGNKGNECRCEGFPLMCPDQFGNIEFKGICKECKEAEKQKEYQDSVLHAHEIFDGKGIA